LELSITRATIIASKEVSLMVIGVSHKHQLEISSPIICEESSTFSLLECDLEIGIETTADSSGSIDIDTAVGTSIHIDFKVHL
jgi:hypothetical protein